jgi:hypothetical protein
VRLGRGEAGPVAATESGVQVVANA